MGQSAPLHALSITSPGVFGLNKQNAGALLPPQWATEALNCVFDDANRLSAREGWLSQTNTAISGTPDIEQIFEYYNPSTGAKYILSAAANDIYSGVSAPAAKKGSLTVSANNWKFVNFNNKVYGIQTGHPLIEWNGSGNFAATTASTGSVPNGNELLSAFGRLWGVSSDGQTVKYSGLLDATYWLGTGAGSINFTSIWSNGADSIVALASFNSFLIVFGSNNIIMMADGSGSTLGLDPQNLYVVDVLSGVGCIARDSVQNINGDDLVFLSNSGVMSLRRAIEQKGNPLSDISKNNRDYLMASVLVNGTSTIRSTFCPMEGMYLLLLPTANKIFYFNNKLAMEDGSWRMTEWNSFIPKSLHTLQDGVTVYCGKIGEIFKYTGNQDDTASYNWEYASGWLAYAPEIQDKYKTLKRIGSVQNIIGDMTLTYKWWWDFKDTPTTIAKNTSAGGAGAEFNLGEWSLGEFGGSYGLVEVEVPAKKSGQYLKVGISSVVNATDISLHQMQIFTKFGRLT